MTRKLILSFFLAIASLSPFSFLNATAAQARIVTLDVPGMTCKFCPITIRKALSKVPGVIGVKSDFDSKTATVTFDPDKASFSDLTKATANSGYPSTVRKQ